MEIEFGSTLLSWMEEEPSLTISKWIEISQGTDIMLNLPENVNEPRESNLLEFFRSSCPRLILVVPSFATSNSGHISVWFLGAGWSSFELVGESYVYCQFGWTKDLFEDRKGYGE